jgi:hypothetical protein
MEISKVLNTLPKNKPDVYNRLYLDAVRRKEKVLIDDVSKRKELRKCDSKTIDRLAKPKKIPEKKNEELIITKKCDGTVFDRLYNNAKRLQNNKMKIEAAKLYILEENSSLTSEEYLKVMEIVETYENLEDILELKYNKEETNKRQKLNINLYKSFRFPNKVELLNLLKKKR